MSQQEKLGGASILGPDPPPPSAENSFIYVLVSTETGIEEVQCFKCKAFLPVENIGQMRMQRFIAALINHEKEAHQPKGTTVFYALAFGTRAAN